MTYCTVKDVERVMGLPSATFDNNSTPSKEQIKSFILSATENINEYTRSAFNAGGNEEDIEADTWTVVDEPKNPTLVNARFGYGRDLRVMTQRPYIQDVTKLEVWQGSRYRDLVAEDTEGRNADWYHDNRRSIYIRTYTYTYEEYPIRVSYEYGRTDLPRSIREAAAMETAIMLILNDDENFLIPEGSGNRQLPFNERVKRYRERRDSILDDYKEIPVPYGV